MAFVLWLFMALVPFYLGKGALRILYGNQPAQDMSLADKVLTGDMLIIGLAEAAHLAGCILGRSFSDCVILFWMMLGVCLLTAVVVLAVSAKRRKADSKRQGKGRQEHTDRERLIYVIFGIIVTAQLVTVVMAQNVFLDGDMTREAVNSFLASDAVYQVNPMTGQAYSLGMPVRLKILCLPTLYAILCRTFGLHADTVVLSVIPAWVLLGTYLAYGTVAKRLFPKQRCARAVFMVSVALLLAMGDYLPAMDGFGVLHNGYRGVAIRAGILIPYTFGLMLRKKYKLVILCVLAEACMVWTLYGLGACAAIALGMLFIQLVCNRYVARESRKGDDVC